MLFAIVAPILLSIYYSMTTWAGFGKLTFVGMKNFREVLFTDTTFWRSVLNAVILMFVTIFIQNPIAFALAGVLRRVGKGSRMFRTIYFVPAILTVVVITKLWVSIYNPNYGLLNKVLHDIGFKSISIAWLSNTSTALGAVIFIMIWWGFGWALLFYYSGLMTMPKEIEEAAIIDGANSLQMYTRVVIPYLMPVIQAVIIIAVISSLKQMEVIYLSTNGQPGDVSQFVANYLYLKAFTYSQYGYGSAVSVVFVVVAIVFTLITRRLTNQSPEAD